MHLERSMKFGFARFEEETSNSTSNQTNPTREIFVTQLWVRKERGSMCQCSQPKAKLLHSRWAP